MHFIAVFEDQKALYEASWSKIQGGQVGNCREALITEADASQMTRVCEREDLILEMRDNLLCIAANDR